MTADPQFARPSSFQFIIPSSALGDGQHLIDLRVFNHLDIAAQPVDLDLVDLINMAKPEPRLGCRLRKVGTACPVFAHLSLASGLKKNLGAVARTVAVPSN